MTLHWWMHWFWITSALIGVTSVPMSVGHPVLSTYQQPNDISTELPFEDVTNAANADEVSLLVPQRAGKAIDVVSRQASIYPYPDVNEATEFQDKQKILADIDSSLTLSTNGSLPDAKDIAASGIDDDTLTHPSTNHTAHDLAFLTLKSDANTSDVELTESGVSPPAQETVEHRSEMAVAKGNHSYANDSTVHDKNRPPLSVAAITGSSFGLVLLCALIVLLSLIIYRRRYLNKPMTFNDKCSNLDSSGYIDDSTLRENSEEMYSLDNDSFLNSLEAMTIQNYWTDSVKHTKL